MTLRPVLALLLSTVFGVWITAHAYCPPMVSLDHGKPAPLTKSCDENALSNWTPQERWVWSQVCRGYIADFNQAGGYGGVLDPTRSNDWPETRILRQDFLETILLYEPWQGMVPRQGVQIVGAWFKETLNLSEAEIKHSLLLNCSRFDSFVFLTGLRADRYLELKYSIFKGLLWMEAMNVKGSLLMKGAQLSDFMLASAQIDGQLDLRNVVVNGKITLELLTVGEAVLMRQAKIAEADATQPFNWVFMNIGGSLDISGAELPSLNLTGSRIGGELWLNQELENVPKWQPQAILVLRNVAVGAIQDAHNAWPHIVELDGFTYGRLGGFTEDKKRDVMTQRASQWFIEWLAKQPEYSPQPYEYLAKVLREGGHQEVAKKILYKSKEIERSKACRSKNPKKPDACDLSVWPYTWLSIQKVLIGYGYYPFQAIYWAIGMIVLGVFFLGCTGQAKKHKMKDYGFSYSLAMLLPIIDLYKYRSDKINLEGCARMYFYIHHIIGYILAIFFGSALAGLVK